MNVDRREEQAICKERRMAMFAVGDRIIYGTKGVCCVESIGKLNAPGVMKDRIYYTLRPYYVKGTTIFTPVDNEKVVMRSALSKEEAMAVVDGIKDSEGLWFGDEKKRELAYKEAIQTCDCNELVKIIKTIYENKQTRLAAGKKVTATDERYFKAAEDSLYGELAISLEMTKEEVKKFIAKRVETD